MLVIRLQRIGRKNKPLYRLVVQEKKWAPSSKAIEIVGHYNPHDANNDTAITLEQDRIKHWISQGAQPSPTVHNMLVNAKIIDAAKMKSVQPKLKKKGKEDESSDESKKQEKKPEEKKEEAKPEEKKEEAKPEEKKEEAKPEEKKEEKS